MWLVGVWARIAKTPGRGKAVLKGMKYMAKFLKRDNFKALYEIGDDAPSIFFEIWYTSANSQIR